MILKNPLSHISGYFISSFMASVVTFVSLPLLIRLLGSVQFGKWSLVEPLQLLLSQSILLGIDYGIIKHINLNKLPPNDTLSKLLMASHPFIFASLFVTFLFLKTTSFSLHEIFWLLLLIYIESVLILIMSSYRAANLVRGYALVAIAKALIFLAVLFIAIFTDYLVIDSLGEVLKWRCISAVLGIGVSLFIVTPSADTYFANNNIEKIRCWQLYKNAVAYGLPLLITGLLTMIVEYADRYILKSYFDYNTLTQYVVYLKIASFLKPLILTPFALWWVTERFRRMEDPDGGKAFFRNTAVWLLVTYIIAGGILWFFSPWLISLIAPGIPCRTGIVLILIVSVIFMGMAYPMNIGLLNDGKTHLNIYGILGGAILHILLCFILIPTFGILGASVATMLSYLAYVLLINMISQRIYRVPFAYFRMFIYFSVAIGGLLIIDLAIMNNGFVASAGKVVCFVVLLIWPTKLITSNRLAFGSFKENN
jgi:O-antigen/teichoic acid export membrane protein